MATVSRIGSVRIAVGGAWDIDDLRQVSEAFSEIYGLFYPLEATDDAVASHLHEFLQKKFGQVTSKPVISALCSIERYLKTSG